MFPKALESEHPEALSTRLRQFSSLSASLLLESASIGPATEGSGPPQARGQHFLILASLWIQNPQEFPSVSNRIVLVGRIIKITKRFRCHAG